MNALTIAFQPQQPLDHAGAADHPSGFNSTEVRRRADAATSLCFAIADCDPEDAIVIMAAALTDLRDKAAFGGKHFQEAAAQYRLERNRSGRAF